MTLSPHISHYTTQDPNRPSVITSAGRRERSTEDKENKGHKREMTIVEGEDKGHKDLMIIIEIEHDERPER